MKTTVVWPLIRAAALASLAACGVFFGFIIFDPNPVSPVSIIDKASTVQAERRELSDEAWKVGVLCNWVSPKECESFLERLESPSRLKKDILEAKAKGVAVVLDDGILGLIRFNRTQNGLIWLDSKQSDDDLADYLEGR